MEQRAPAVRLDSLLPDIQTIDKQASCLTISCYKSHTPTACGATRCKVSVAVLTVLARQDQTSKLIQEQQQVGWLGAAPQRCGQAQGMLLARTISAANSSLLALSCHPQQPGVMC